MIRFHRTFRGVVASSLVMIPIYIVGWLYEIGGTAGMMSDESYPVSLLLLPLSAAVISGGAFWVLIYPWAQISRWIANKNGLSLSNGGAITVYVPSLFGILAGLASDGIFAALAAGCYLGMAALHSGSHQRHPLPWRARHLRLDQPMPRVKNIRPRSDESAVEIRRELGCVVGFTCCERPAAAESYSKP